MNINKIRNTFFLFLVIINVAKSQNESCPCCAAGYRQFDFWLGEWEVFNAKNVMVGTNNIVSMQDKCLLQENWVSKSQTGTSYNYYNPKDSIWTQIYVDNVGTILELRGKYQDGTMVLKSEPQMSKNGYYYINRIIWKLTPEGHVTQVWDIIDKNDKILQSAFNGIYKRKADTKKQQRIGN
jgi:hypothetical protein